MKFTILCKVDPKIERDLPGYFGKRFGNGVSLERIDTEQVNGDLVFMLRCKSGIVAFLKHRRSYGHCASHFLGWKCRYKMERWRNK